MYKYFLYFLFLVSLVSCDIISKIIEPMSTIKKPMTQERQLKISAAKLTIEKLDPYNPPKNCDPEKIYVFKVVCDSGKNIFGIDRSFVEAVCASEIEMLNNKPKSYVYDFLQKRLEHYNQNRNHMLQRMNERVNVLSNVAVYGIINLTSNNAIQCTINGGADNLEVSADVQPDCIDDTSDIFYNNNCGVEIQNLRVTNNSYSISLKMDGEGKTPPFMAYNFTSGYIYYGFKNSSQKSRDPFNNPSISFHMNKDSSAILDKYK